MSGSGASQQSLVLFQILSGLANVVLRFFVGGGLFCSAFVVKDCRFEAVEFGALVGRVVAVSVGYSVGTQCAAHVLPDNVVGPDDGDAFAHVGPEV
jgi:hypothetical protein